MTSTYQRILFYAVTLLFFMNKAVVGQCGLNQSMPDNQAALETLNLAIATCYAPTY